MVHKCFAMLLTTVMNRAFMPVRPIEKTAGSLITRIRTRTKNRFTDTIATMSQRTIIATTSAKVFSGATKTDTTDVISTARTMAANIRSLAISLGAYLIWHSTET